MDPRVPTFAPPPGFIEVQSSLEGIWVFAPAPETEPGYRDQKCPNCAGILAFNIDVQALSCTTCETVVERATVVGKAGRAHLFTREALAAAGTGWGVERRNLHCSGCGSDITLEAGAIATTCPFCASNRVEIGDDPGVGTRPGFVLPFQVPAAALPSQVKTWLGTGWKHPRGLAALARVDRMTAIYLPYWLFDARATAKWEAEVGYDKTVTRTRSDGSSYTETVTTWYDRAGAVDRRWEGVRVPGVSRISKVIIERVHGAFDLSALAEYDPGILAGSQAQSWDIGLVDAWADGKQQVRDLTRGACVGDAGGDRIRNLTVEMAMDDENWRYALLPFYITAYKYQRKVYQVMVNGQTGLIDGQKPVAWWKIYGLIVLFFSPQPPLLLLSLLLILTGPGMLFALVPAAVLGFFALIGSILLWGSAVESEKA